MRLRQDSGAVLAEFAFVLPLLALFLVGIVQFGLAFSRAQGMEAAAREGARLASVGRDVEYVDVQSAARAAAPLFITATHIDVGVEYRDGSGTWVTSTADWCQDTGTTIRVTVSINPSQRARYAVVIPFCGDTAPSYAARGIFRCEAPHS